jgi:hydroxymethylpyrimidine/phosphomethylpyrimidine kinase
VVLSIAGSDSSAGAGLQADLKTCAALGVYACTAVTAITAQNTLGVQQSWPVRADQLRAQLDAIDVDIELAAIKVGMLGDEGLVLELVDWLTQRRAAGRDCPVVIDPVLVSSSGCLLLSDAGQEALIEQLLPLTALVTPNLPELAALLNTSVAQTNDQLHDQAEALLRLGPRAVLVKGGHAPDEQDDASRGLSVDWLLSQRLDPATGKTFEAFERFASERIISSNDHGTGCTLASAIAACLAYQVPLGDAVADAKKFLSGALFHADQLTIGGLNAARDEAHSKLERHGPLHHFYRQWPNDNAMAEEL